MIGIFEDNGYETLARALAPLEQDKTIVYLPGFEDCSANAWRRIYSEDEDWSGVRGFVMFSEYAKDRADSFSELYLTVSSFKLSSNDEDAKIRELVRKALLASGYTEVETPDDEVTFNQNQESNSFYMMKNGINLLGFFGGEAKTFEDYEAKAAKRTRRR